MSLTLTINVRVTYDQPVSDPKAAAADLQRNLDSTIERGLLNLPCFDHLAVAEYVADAFVMENTDETW